MVTKRAKLIIVVTNLNKNINTQYQRVSVLIFFITFFFRNSRIYLTTYTANMKDLIELEAA